jgi:hypothetical protein
MIPIARQCAAAMKSTGAVRPRAAALLLVVCATVVSALSSTPAFGFSQQQCYQEASTGGEVPNGQCHPGWEVWSNTRPTHIEPGAKGLVELAIFNIGGAAPTGKVTVTDVLPAGVTAIKAGHEAFAEELGTEIGLEHGINAHNTPTGKDPWECSGTTVVTCTAEPGNETFPLAGGGAGAGHPMNVGILVEVADGTTEGALPNEVTVVGGGAPTPASTSQPITVSSKPAGFGIATWNVWFSNKDGTSDTQAGSHPYAATFAFELNTWRARGFTFKEEVPETEEEYFNGERHAHGEADLKAAGGSVESIAASLPPGLFADVHALPQCTRQELNVTNCPPQSQIGIIDVYDIEGADFGYPVYNMVAPSGSPAEFGFDYEAIDTFLESTVRTGSDYSVKTTTAHIPQRDVEGAVLTLWGYPADRSHDAWRNGNTPGCDASQPFGCTPSDFAPVTGVAAKPFLTLPTECAGPPQFSLSANTWQDPSRFAEASVLLHTAGNVPTGITGCDIMAFNPLMTIAPDTSSADTPAGLTAEVTPSVGGLSELEGRSTADIENTKVVLPPGVAINPGQAAGLQACQPSQSAIGTEAPASCPAASKVGTFSIETPLLTQHFEGNIYVLQSNPPNVELLLAASSEGVNLKLVGKVHLDESTGQLITTFAKTPELPFTDFKLSFSGGAQAALVTPAQCGNYTSAADFTPWSSPFTSDVLDEPTFAIVSGAGGSPCPPSSLPFAPSLIAGSTTDQAGGFTNFSLLLQRGDGQQRINGLQFKAPEGLTGELANVPLCTNAQAEANACPEASKIGHTVVESGPGPYPLVVPEPSQPPAPIYLTESYDGAPFGLSIVVPLHVGPFTLPTQRVRAKIEVNPYTSALIVTTDPLPQIVAGVPTDLREIDAVIERPEFMVNPTNCNPSEFSGTAYGTPPPGVGGPGATASISSHFQVGACRALEFTPKFSVSTSGKTSKANGASLTAKVTYPKVPQGTDADISSVKVELPKALPSRLTTLQKACTNAQFEANPAACPAASKIGYAVVRTPLLPVPLTGPAIFVSHGGEAFPSLTMVLQGDGVTVDLVGATFISKAGITSTTFKTVPDDPFSTFELTLPEGPYSALTANGNLCGSKLVIPNEFVGQNGAVIKRNTDIVVEGCKPAIYVVKHSVKGKTATIQVSVPSAGKLVASGKGLSKASKTSKGRETVTVSLRQKKGGKLKTTVHLSFAPKKGKKQSKTITVRFKQ